MSSRISVSYLLADVDIFVGKLIKGATNIWYNREVGTFVLVEVFFAVVSEGIIIVHIVNTALTVGGLIAL